MPFICQDCPQLTAITILKNSFLFYSTCQLENLPSLTSLSIGSEDSSGNFIYVSTLKLDSFPSLERIDFQNYSFTYSQNLTISNMPKLKSIFVGDWVFSEQVSTEEHSFPHYTNNKVSLLGM